MIQYTSILVINRAVWNVAGSPKLITENVNKGIKHEVVACVRLHQRQQHKITDNVIHIHEMMEETILCKLESPDLSSLQNS